MLYDIQEFSGELASKNKERKYFLLTTTITSAKLDSIFAMYNNSTIGKKQLYCDRTADFIYGLDTDFLQYIQKYDNELRLYVNRTVLVRRIYKTKGLCECKIWNPETRNFLEGTYVMPIFLLNNLHNEGEQFSNNLPYAEFQTLVSPNDNRVIRDPDITVNVCNFGYGLLELWKSYGPIENPKWFNSLAAPISNNKQENCDITELEINKTKVKDLLKF